MSILVHRMLLLRLPAVRRVLTTRHAMPSVQRPQFRLLCTSKGSVTKVAEEGAPPPMNVAQAAKTGATLTMWGGVAVLVSVCGYFVVKELWPSQMSPNSCFSAAFEFVKEHPEITSRLGPGLRAYGRDTHRGKEGRRNFVSHDKFVDEDGKEHIRIKFNIEGPNGKGVVYAEAKAGQPTGHFEYVIFERIMRGRRETFALVDNRVELTREALQEKVAKRLAANGGVLYGSTTCQWTERQKQELGEFSSLIKYYACDRPENKYECEKEQLKGFPTWKVKGQLLPSGFKRLEDLQSLVRQL